MQIDRPIAIALTLFVILLLVFFLVSPEYTTFGKLQTELGEKTAEYNAEYAYYNAIAATYATLQSNQDNLKMIDDALPQNSDLGATIYFFQKIANENGLIIKNLFLSKTASGNMGTSVSSNVKDMTFSMDLSGGYPSLEGFIMALEKSSRIFEVTSISFGAASATAGQDFNLQIKTHSY